MALPAKKLEDLIGGVKKVADEVGKISELDKTKRRARPTNDPPYGSPEVYDVNGSRRGDLERTLDEEDEENNLGMKAIASALTVGSLILLKDRLDEFMLYWAVRAGDLQESDIDEMYLILRYGFEANELDTPRAHKVRRQMEKTGTYKTFQKVAKPFVKYCDQHIYPVVKILYAAIDLIL